MGYQVRVTVVDDSDLPGGLGWAMVRGSAGSDLLIARSHSTEATGLCEVLAEAWRGAAHFSGGAVMPVAV